MKTPSIDELIKKIKSSNKAKDIGMVLLHNGIVRESSKDGTKKVKKLILEYNQELLDHKVKEILTNDGVIDVYVFINRGELNIGDDIMIVIVAGDRRSNIFKPFADLIEYIKSNVVSEQEVYEWGSSKNNSTLP